MVLETRNIVQCIKYFSVKLSEIYPVDEAESMAHYYFENKLNLSRLQIYENRERMVSSDFYTKDLDRLLLHEPVQYVINTSWFYGNCFFVDKGVLIPRTETEELVQKLLETDSLENKRILDVGTGSGCIAISLKKICPSATVFAMDISDVALEIARRNAKDLNVNINFVKDDILNLTSGLMNEKFDLIISNPPYVLESEMDKMRKNVTLYEPSEALYVSNNDPLLYYDRIGDFALTNLNENGILYFEVNENFCNEVCQSLKDKKYSQIEPFKDIHGKWRIVRAKK